MEFFFVLTARFLKDGGVHEETFPDTIVAREGETMQELYWRACDLFERGYGCGSHLKVLHWSIQLNELPTS